MLWLARARVLRGARARALGDSGVWGRSGMQAALRRFANEPAVNGPPARRSVRAAGLPAALHFAPCRLPGAHPPAPRARPASAPTPQLALARQDARNRHTITRQRAVRPVVVAVAGRWRGGR
eukprot:scaffold13617_cov112-Isochrysis_galbana.AAC.4